ncbi:MAG TPA: hypothetical protein VGT61_08920 [Thermomicrobiales bacterium]|jgi:hypothetical protein|nr:hypothetical protein [Thermomicrobiales bacterium]
MTDETAKQDLPEAFTSPDPAPEDAADRVGAGHVVDGKPAQARGDTDDEEVEEASEESFPGSDPPQYRGNTRN